MSDIIIRAENVGKRYVLNHQTKPGGYNKFSDVLVNAAKSPLRWLKTANNEQQTANSKEDFWALKDVSFEIKRGDVVGVIGRNGAGKSTLLKILSRITEPTKGRITLNGRVASLLEVGTGFHPELTGRENIFLNGAILGMRKEEIKAKFDEIVAFAEVERFLDTPVKRYSSGMYVRLAFAVAAHLEPEILIIDEVLAVGDAQFQKKCLGKLQSISSNHGRTVLFVSHHMASIQRMCNRCILMGSGKVIEQGETTHIIESYFRQSGTSESIGDLSNLPPGRRRGTGAIQFSEITINGLDGKSKREFRQNEPMVLTLTLQSQSSVDDVTFGFSFIAQDGTEIMGSVARDCGVAASIVAGTGKFECLVKPMILCPGRYTIRGAVFRLGEVFDHIDEMIDFDVLSSSMNLEIAPGSHQVGNVYLPFVWKQL